MTKLRLHRDQIALAAAVVLPLCVAAVLVPFRSSFANTASALILVAVIVAVATVGNRFSGFVATISATVWFDYFLTRPYEKLAITHRPDIETAVSLFIVGIIVTELAARNRYHHESAVEEADFVGLIHAVSEFATSGAPPRQVIDRVRNELVTLLHLQACRYESGPVDKPMIQLGHDGQVQLGGRVWDVDRMGLPGPEIMLLTQNRGTTLGRFVMTPTPGYEISYGRRRRGSSHRRSGRSRAATPVRFSPCNESPDRAPRWRSKGALQRGRKPR